MAVVVVTMVVGCVLVGLVASLLRYDAELAWTSSKVTVRSKNVAAITLLFDHGGFLDIISKIDFVVGLGRERLSSPEIEPASNTHNRHLPFEVWPAMAAVSRLFHSFPPLPAVLSRLAVLLVPFSRRF